MLIKNIFNLVKVSRIRQEKRFQQSFLIIIGTIPAFDEARFVIDITFFSVLFFAPGKPFLHFVGEISSVSAPHGGKRESSKSNNNKKTKQKLLSKSSESELWQQHSQQTLSSSTTSLPTTLTTLIVGTNHDFECHCQTFVQIRLYGFYRVVVVKVKVLLHLQCVQSTFGVPYTNSTVTLPTYFKHIKNNVVNQLIHVQNTII